MSYNTRMDVTVRVPAPSARYIDEMLSLKCAGDIAHLYPNAKEVTESFAMFNAVRKTFGPQIFGDDRVVCVCPGDGVAPRTGGLFAFRTRWQVYSIDPIMATRHVVNKSAIERLTCTRLPIEQVRPILGDHIIVVACHSHAKLSNVLSKLAAWSRLDVFSMPCCVPDDMPIKPTKSYRDNGVWSPENLINYYSYQ